MKLSLAFVFLLFSNLTFSQEKICDNIIGHWQIYKLRTPFNSHTDNNSDDIWFFKKNKILYINATKLNYQLTSDCLKLSLVHDNKNYNFSIYKLTKDSLSIKLRILPHESLNIYFKKINNYEKK